MAKNIGEVEVDVKYAMRSLMVQVIMKGIKTFSFRLWLAAQLIRLAAKIAPIAVELIHRQEEQKDD